MEGTKVRGISVRRRQKSEKRIPTANSKTISIDAGEGSDETYPKRWKTYENMIEEAGKGKARKEKEGKGRKKVLMMGYNMTPWTVSDPFLTGLWLGPANA